MKHLFIRGPAGAGKSLLIREVLHPHLKSAGGFYVQRIFTGGRYAAFRLNPLAKEKEYVLNICEEAVLDKERVFLDCHEKGIWKFHAEVFETYGVSYLKKSVSEGKRLILLDEIGGMELNCPLFMQTLQEIFKGFASCLGVIKSGKNRDSLIRHVQAIDKDMEAKFQKIDLVLHGLGEELEIMDMTPQNYDLVKERLTTFIGDKLL